MKKKSKKLIRTSTISMSLNILLKGQLAFLSKYFEVIAVSGKGDYLEEISKREGVLTHAIEIERNISPIRDLVSLVKLFFYFRKERPLIVHSITPKAGLLTMVAGFFAGVPIRMHTFTGLIFPYRNGIMQKVLILMDKIVCYCATNIYPEGQGVKNDLIKYGITSKPLRIIANGNVNGIDMDYFCLDFFPETNKESLKENLGITSSDFVFIFVGRLVSDKGINELVGAFQNISSEISHVKLLLVGSLESDLDPLHSETIRKIRENTQIISVGFQNDVRPYFAISNCLIFPSYREGFPNVVMQAGAMELPSIVTNINGSNEIIVAGQNGLIIPSKDSIAIEKAMLKIMEDRPLYHKLKSVSREMIAARYEQRTVWNAILEEYKILEQSV